VLTDSVLLPKIFSIAEIILEYLFKSTLEIA